MRFVFTDEHGQEHVTDDDPPGLLPILSSEGFIPPRVRCLIHTDDAEVVWTGQEFRPECCTTWWPTKEGQDDEQP